MRRCGCVRIATAAENRAYEAKVKSLGGRRDPRARAWIEAEHQKFKAGQTGCRAAHGGGFLGLFR